MSFFFITQCIRSFSRVLNSWHNWNPVHYHHLKIDLRGLKNESLSVFEGIEIKVFDIEVFEIEVFQNKVFQIEVLEVEVFEIKVFESKSSNTSKIE